MESQLTSHNSNKTWYDKNYKKLLVIPLLLLLLSISYLIFFYFQNGDLFRKDISLTGGTSVIINAPLDINNLTKSLSNKLDEIQVRGIYDLITNQEKAVVINTKSSPEKTKLILEEYLGYKLTEENSSFEFTNENVSQSFYKQLLIALIFAFLFMGIVVFLIFRNFVPSLTIIFCVFADILMTLATINLLGLSMSTAGIVALLMLIGYSVDTDILLTSRVLKRHDDSLNKKLLSSLKTGLTMTLASLFAFALALLVVKSISNILTQIFTILIIGLFFDIINTWVTNTSVLKWYLERKNHG